MAIREVARMGHPVLLRPAAPVDDPTAPEIAALARDMQETIEHIGANGIAANQVFETRRVVVYRFAVHRIPKGSPLQPVPWTVMVNPAITPIGRETEPFWERCLSVPGLHGKVLRHTHIGIRFQTPAGRTVEEEVKGPVAALLQHECDHLDGVLYPMRIADMSTLSFNTDPGRLAEDAARNSDIDPILRALVDNWADRQRWLAAS